MSLPILLRGLGALAITAIVVGGASAQQTRPIPSPSTAVTIDLPTVLDRAGANSIDLALAREAVAQAKASDLQATMKLFPYLTLGGQYYDHGGGVANVNGVVIDADKSLSTLSATITAQIDLGNAIGGKMIAEERQVGAKARLDAQRGTTIRNAALAYFELAGSGAEVGVLRDAVRTSEDYQAQLGRAVDLGLAARSEAIRAEVEVQTNKIALRQAEERAARASAALSELLRSTPGVALAPGDDAQIPVRLVPENLSLDDMIAKAMESRPELAQSRSDMKAADLSHSTAVYGPLLPTVTAQYGQGRLRGGPDGFPSITDNSDDAQVLFTWRVGPGGLFDFGRIDEAESLLRQSKLLDAKVRDAIGREVVESREGLRSAQDQMELARSNVESATRNLELSQQRRDFGFAAVLETIIAQQQLVAARRAYIQAVTQHNRAQYSLARAIGLID